MNTSTIDRGNSTTNQPRSQVPFGGNISNGAMVVTDDRVKAFYQIDCAVYERYTADIGSVGLAVYNALVRYADYKGVYCERGNSYPSVQSIADRLYLSRPCVMKYIQRLLQVGLIRQVGLPNSVTGGVNHYAIRVVDDNYQPLGLMSPRSESVVRAARKANLRRLQAESDATEKALLEKYEAERALATTRGGVNQVSPTESQLPRPNLTTNTLSELADAPANLNLAIKDSSLNNNNSTPAFIGPAAAYTRNPNNSPAQPNTSRPASPNVTTVKSPNPSGTNLPAEDNNTGLNSHNNNRHPQPIYAPTPMFTNLEMGDIDTATATDDIRSSEQEQEQGLEGGGKKRRGRAKKIEGEGEDTVYSQEAKIIMAAIGGKLHGASGCNTEWAQKLLDRNFTPKLILVAIDQAAMAGVRSAAYIANKILILSQKPWELDYYDDSGNRIQGQKQFGFNRGGGSNTNTNFNQPGRATPVATHPEYAASPASANAAPPPIANVALAFSQASTSADKPKEGQLPIDIDLSQAAQLRESVRGLPDVAGVVTVEDKVAYYTNKVFSEMEAAASKFWRWEDIQRNVRIPNCFLNIAGVREHYEKCYKARVSQPMPTRGR